MKQDDPRVDVLLLAPHTHLGEQKKKGDVINVTNAQAEWLVNHGVARLQLTKTKPQEA